MAKKSLWQRVKNKVKEWVSGGKSGGSAKQTKATPPAPRTVATNRDARNQTVSSRTSPVNRRAFISSLKDTQKEQKEENRVANAFKATDTSKSYKDLTAALKNDVPDPKQAAAQQAQKRAKATLGKAKDTLRDNAKYLGNDTERETISAIKKWNDSNKQQKKEFNERTNHKYDVKYWEEKGDKKKAQEARIRVKSGENASDIVAEELAVKYHPIASSAARGAASGATFGATELAIKAQAKRDKERAKNEQYYQEHKSKTAETVGELAGALASFGVTAGATDRLGAKAVSKVAPNAAERLAETKVVQGLAKRGVNKAVEKGLVGEASEELIKQVGKEKAKKIVAAVGNDIIQNATTGLLYDFNKASAVHEIGSKEWRKEMGKSAAFNAAITGGIAGGAILGGNKKLATEEAIKLFEKQRKQAVEEGAEGVKTFLHAKRGVGAGNAPKNKGRLFGESLDDKLGIANKAEVEEVAETTAKGTKPAAANLKPTEEVAERGARSVEDINRELDAVYDEIARNGDMPEERLSALLKRADDLKAERNALEESAETAAKSVDEAAESKAALPTKEQDYRVNVTYKSGSQKTLKFKATSREEAIAMAENTNGVESVSDAKGVEDEWNEKRNAILDFIGESDEAASTEAANVASEAAEPNAVPSMREQEFTVQATYASGIKRKEKVKALSQKEAIDQVASRKKVKSATIVEPPEVKGAAKGTKPAANTLNVKSNTAPKADEFKPQSIDDITNNSGVKHEKVSNKEKTRDFWGSFRTKFVDSLDAYEQWNKQFLKTDPEKWALNYGAIDKLRRSQAQAARSIGNVQLGWDGKPLKSTLADGDAKSLKAIYDGLDEEREKLFETYLLLKHAPDRAAAGKPIYKGRYASAEACEKDAKEILDNNPDFKDRADELYQYTRNELQNRADAGLLPQEVVDDWFKKYPHYVPTGRAGEFKPDEDIWEVAHDLARNGNTVRAGDIKAAEKNVSDLPIRSIKEQLSEATTRNWRDMSLNNLLRRMYGDEIANKLAVEADGGLATVLDNTVNLKSGKGGKYYAEVFIDGKANRVEIEKRFYDAIKDLNKNGRVGDAIDFASDVAAVPSYYFKNFVTSWNPIFMVKNGLRDFPEAIINSRYTKEFIGSMGLAKNDLYGIEGGGMWTQALRNQGVSQANFVNLEEALTKERMGVVGKAADKFATLQESVETYPRLVEFMATVKGMGYDLNTGLPMKVIDALKEEGYDLSKGIGELSEDALAKVDDLVKGMGYDLRAGVGNVPMEVLDVAAANAADVTVNFGRSGSIGKMLNRGFVPFFNPSVQGFDKFIRNLSQQPSGKALLGTIAKAFALGTGATAINNMLLSDNPYYQQISARDKATNIIIACPIKFEDGKMSVVDADEANIFIKIPKSRFAAAYSIPMVNVANDNKMHWAEMFKVVGDQVAPVNPIESNILAPFALAAANKTWYGTPIVSQGIENKTNPSQEYDANTSLIGKALGKATSKLPKEFQISPKKADYVIDANTGVIGDFLLPALTPSRQGDGGFVNKYITHPAGNVVKRAFTIDANTQNDLSTRFYNELQKATDNSNSEIGTQEDKEEYKRLNAYSKETAGINKAIRYLQGSDSPTKQKDIYELQKVRNQLMQDALDGKGVPTSERMLNAVQKYVGTTYAVDSFGSSADQEAMKVYGEAKYGNLSEDEMRKRIDSDDEFLNGIRAIGGLEDKMEKAGVKSNTVLSRAVALASANASDDMFGAYKCTKQSRTETADKMTRARDYIKSGGSDDEFVKLENARKTMGKLSDYDKDAELDKIDKQLANGEISYDEYYNKQGEIKYNANISRVGLATSLALANSPERAYKLYDIKPANIQKGINLAAMGYDARDYREMAKAVDTSGNGYLSKQEVVDYVANSGVSDKATLFEALYPYTIKYNPFGTPTKYSIAAAAQAGAGKGIEAIGGKDNNFSIKADGKSSGNSYGGYGGRRRYRYGGGGSRGVTVSALPQSNYKASKQTYKDIAASLKTGGTTTTSTASKVKIEPPKVKFKEYEV